jgi:hypothetical protein
MTVALSPQTDHPSVISAQIRSLALAAGERIDDARIALEESLQMHRHVLAHSPDLKADTDACLTWKAHIYKLREALAILSDLY